MSEVEVFLDDTPGEVRGIVSRDGRYDRLIIHRETDPPEHRLGARSIGRVIDAGNAFGAAFVDLGGAGQAGILRPAKGETLKTGELVDVEVTAEPRESKGPVLKRLGAGEGKPRLLSSGPDVEQRLRTIAPGAEIIRGVDAIRAGLEAEEEALATRQVFSEWALDLSVQRTRALIAVDIDYAHLAGRDAKKGRAQANRQGLKQAARRIRLNGWGGLVAIDLVGTTLDSAQVAAMAKDAFGGDEAQMGPLSRFGLLQLALPWRTRPVEEQILDAEGRRFSSTRALDLVRQLRLALLTDTSTPRFVAFCATDLIDMATPLVTRLGPRAGLTPDPAAAPGRFTIKEG
jgi:Ribonuclease G/E